MTGKESQTAFSVSDVPNCEENIKIQEKYAKNVCIFTLSVLYCMGVKINHQKIQILGAKMVRPVTKERGNSNAQVCLPVHRR
jgi:hypothetical protein